LKVTNKHNVPETLVALATRDYYSKGKADYSVTEIISPPRIQRLRRQYNEQMEQDVSDMLWQLLGSALHVVAERGVADGHITEERLITEIDGVKLSGQSTFRKLSRTASSSPTTSSPVRGRCVRTSLSGKPSRTSTHGWLRRSKGRRSRVSRYAP
jgi:hypothetical protein